MNKETNIAMIEQFEALSRNPVLRQFIKNGQQVFGGQQGYPFYSYLGINYTPAGILNIKAYFNFFKKIEYKELENFFPELRAVKDFYDNYQSSIVYDRNNMGVTVALKIEADGSHSHTFYVRDAQQKTPPPANIQFPAWEQKILHDYFACQLKNGTLTYKNYYVIMADENKDLLLNLFGLQKQIDGKAISGIEYVDYAGQQKIALAIENKEKLSGFLSHFFDNEEIRALSQKLRTEYGLHPFSPGLYLNSPVKSIYYIDSGERFYMRNSCTLLNLAEKLFHV